MTIPNSAAVRALLAIGAGGSAIVLATDSTWLAHDIESINDLCDDLGIETPGEGGLWLWEGVARETRGSGPDFNEPETEYEGRCRRPDAHELPALLAMEPPLLCVACGKPAVDVYPDADGEPSCGAAECEFRMQAAADYHDERGG